MNKNELFRAFGDETFGIFNGKVMLNRYKVEWEKRQPIISSNGMPIKKDGKPELETVLNVMCFTSKDILDDHVGDNGDKYTIIEIDQSSNEWIEGLEFDGYQEARAALDMGEKEYFESKPLTIEERFAVLNEVIDRMLIDSLGGAK